MPPYLQDLPAAPNASEQPVKKVLISAPFDDPSTELVRTLDQSNYHPIVRDNLTELLELLSEATPAVLVADVSFAEIELRDLLDGIERITPTCQVVVYSGDEFKDLERGSRTFNARIARIKAAVDSVSADLTTVAVVPANTTNCILLVDDDTDQHSLIESLMCDENTDVVATESTMVASLIRKHKPAVILLDVGLPGVRQGTDIARFLKESGLAEDAPVVLYSGRSDEELATLAASCGADGYITKARPPAELKVRIRSWIK